MGYISVLLMLGSLALHSHGQECSKLNEPANPQGSIRYSGSESKAACDWNLPDIKSQGLIIHMLNISLRKEQRNKIFSIGYVILPGNVSVRSPQDGRWFAYSRPNSACSLSHLAELVGVSSPDTFTWIRLSGESATMDVKFRSEDSELKSFHLNYTYVVCKDTASSTQQPTVGRQQDIVVIPIMAGLGLIAIIFAGLYIHQRVTNQSEQTKSRGDCRAVYTSTTNESDGAGNSRQQEPISEINSHSYLNPYEEIPAQGHRDNYSEVVPNTLYNRT